MTITEDQRSLTEVASLVLNAFAKWLVVALQDAQRDPRYMEEVKSAFENSDDSELATLLQRAVGEFK